MLYFFMVAHKTAGQTLSKAFLKSTKTRWRSGAGDISHIECVGLRSALWSSFLFWSLPVLQQWSSPLVASICSVWFSAWLCLVDWWGLLFGSSSTAGFLSWEVWWLRTGFTLLAIVLSARSYCRLSWEQWLHPLHQLGPVLLGCCRLQLTSFFPVIVLHPPLLCEGWDGHRLCLSANTPVLMDLDWPCDCTAQCSILSIRSVSLVLLWGIFLNYLGQ